MDNAVFGLHACRQFCRRRSGGYGDFDGFLLRPCFDGSAETVFQQFGEDVFQMHGNMCDGGFGVSNDIDGRSQSVLQLADVSHHVFAVFDDVGGFQVCVYDANVCGILRRRGRVGEISVWLGGEVEGDVLLSDETGADASAKVFVEEASDFLLADVLSRLQEAASENSYGVTMCLDEVDHDLGEGDFLLQALQLPLGIWEKGGQRVDVVLVDLADMWVGYDNVREGA